MPAPASKVAWRLLAACAIANSVCQLSPATAQSVASRTDAPPSAQSAERQDSFYCEERRLGYWFYCERPKTPGQNSPSPAPTSSATSQLDAITATLRELKAKAILEPTPANVTAYIRFQRAQLDRASLFSDVWQRAIWQDPELDYTLQRPVSTLGKRQWQDSRSAERNAAMAQLSERYGLFYFFAQSCGACEVMSPIVQSVASTWHIAVRAISTDGGPSRHFPNYTVETNQRSRMGLEPKITPAVVLWDARTGRPIPIGYGVMSADELQDRIYLLTSKEAGRDY
ncbi:conjugal transfer protein TraF [Rhizorhabdus wittichii DC-6]|uniref:Conjugal transfer protein TraF n=1 Tax=Sphingobium cyanobacteriorum TaxID=3063954 RepID=A0ABT8ZKP8_9SPHN|nr:conjugal transfer protein TraF [Sphingobium sp. HBC34]ARR56537.1 conjugal transfer protein TraF [Rhizorhabdus wittichii DC-6]MDO7835114.1 conjugal transfer protein TraF [Sphingobium sp. HBC34]